MKIFTLLSAGLLAVGTLGAVAIPTAADAQRQGWHDDRRGPDYRDHRGYRGDRRGYRHDRYRGGRGYRGGRVVCRVRRTNHGPVRTCFRR